MARRTLSALCALCIGLSLVAQSNHSDPVTAPLLRGHLVLWIVHDLPPSPQQLFSGTVHMPGYQEHNAGQFGYDAGRIGQTAGTYGQTAGRVGQPAGEVGQNAGSAGQTAGSFGRDAASTGRDAGRTGQMAGRFGYSVNTLNNATTQPEKNADAAFHHPPHNTRWDAWLSHLRTTFPDLQIKVVDVRSDELQPQLRAAQHTPDAPDVLLGDPLPDLWTHPSTGLGLEYGIANVGAHSEFAEIELPAGVTTEPQRWQPEASALRAAPHPEAARAFLFWLDTGSGCASCGTPLHIAAGSPDAVAVQALDSILDGAGIGAWADPRMASFSTASARREALGSPARTATFHIDVLDSSANDKLAVVMLRAVLSEPLAVGALDAAAVLRRDARGRWRILQITPNLTEDQLGRGWPLLASFAQGDHRASVGGASLAAPRDGENRSPQPELWWDNKGGAGLQIVEWQINAGAHSPVSHLFFVPDANMVLRTRVTAQFATLPVSYRWRVWSVGSGGELVLSPWRTFNVVP
jgi:hypothetical protein